MKDLIWSLISKDLWSNNPDREELASDVVQAACKYAKYRIDWYGQEPEWRSENDKYRTSAHNRFIDTLTIYIRFCRMQGDANLPELDYTDRKTMGDYACYIAYKIALQMR